MLIGEDHSAGVKNGAYRPTPLFLCNGSSDARRVSVTVEAEGSGNVSSRVPVGENENKRSCEFHEKGANGALLCGEGRDRA